MPFSSDDFDNWQRSQAAPHASAQPRGASPDHPLLHACDTTGMPIFAKMRLQEHVKSARAPFTSNLSIAELLLTRKVGFHPVAQVIGTSVYHVGLQWLPANMFASSMELVTLTHARMEAWQFATERLAQQARVAGAHVVVGVHLDRHTFDSKRPSAEAAGKSGEEHDPQGDIIEVSLLGTAARYGGQINMDRPLLSTLTGEEFLTLRAAGCVPVGIAYGCCVYYQASTWSRLQGTASPVAWGTQWTNQEITEYSHGVRLAQYTAAERMRDQAMSFGGSGVLDVRFSRSMREVEHDIHDMYTDRDTKQAGIIITAEAVGTAILEIEPDADPPVDAVLPLA